MVHRPQEYKRNNKLADLLDDFSVEIAMRNHKFYANCLFLWFSRMQNSFGLFISCQLRISTIKIQR